MLRQILFNSSLDTGMKIVYTLIMLFCVLLSISVHEMFHGYVAYWMGDTTAKYTGRLTLNPLHHLDPIGAICLFLFGFGWAKPVMVNPRNFRNQKAGMVMTALGGPISNFVLAFIAQIGVMYFGSKTFVSDANMGFKLTVVVYIICYYLVQMNLGLGLFNLIPIPPLDGSKILNAILPGKVYFKIMEYERYGFLILIILINTPIFDSFLFGGENLIISAYESVIKLLPFIH